MRILLLGKNGQIGWELQKALAHLGNVKGLGHTEIDLENHPELHRYVEDYKPNVIVNASGYTDVNRAESDLEQALKINGVVPGILAEEAKRAGAIYIDYSTDYVFNGMKRSPYTEKDEPDPINTYGKTKLAGEEAIQSVGGAYFIIRTSWVYGMRGRNFVLTILRLARERKTLKIVNDQMGCPTWSREIAQTTFTMLFNLLQTNDWYNMANSLAGIYHYSASGTATWFDFAKAILESDPEKHTYPAPDLVPISTIDYPSPVQRPLYSVLSTHKLKRRFGISPLSWETQLQRCWRNKLKCQS